MLARVILSDRNFCVSKEYELSAIPLVGFDLSIRLNPRGKHVSARVMHIRQYIDEGHYEIFCDCSRNALCHLYRYGQISDGKERDGRWEMPELKEFLEDKDTKRGIRETEELDKKIAAG